MTPPPSKTGSLHPFTVSDRLQANPPQALESSFWFSDREIGARRPRRALDYSADDFRQELARVERKLYWLSFVSIIVAVLAVAAIVFVILHTSLNGA